MREDALFPYHYPKEEFEQARDRILQLLNRIDLDVIMKADNTDIYHKIFFLRTRKPSQLSFSVSSTGLSVSCNNVVLHYQKKIEAYILKTGAHGKEWRMTGFLKSPVFSICEEKPRLFLGKMRSYGEERLECPLFESSWSLHRSKTKTNIFWGFDIRIPLFEESVFCLEVELSGATLPVAYCFSDKAIFSGKLKRWSYAVNNCVISVDASGYMSIDPNNPRKAKESRTESDLIAKRHNAKAYLIRRAMALLPARTKSLWLYYDRGAVGKDNAFFQFMHDIETNDGIERYYVTSLDAGKWTEVFGSRYKKHIVSFDSNKHKILHLQADLLLVAYIEEENWLPFNKRSYPYFADLIRYGIIHLQHGVLHAHQPWKHSFDRLLIDGEVVSTNYELTNFQQNYLFPREALIDSGMPRYDFIDSDAEPKRRILFAPSWRKYLVHQTQKLDFEPIDNVFLDSAWWKEVSTFLNSETLAEMLDAYDYHLDIKLHPIFKVYSRFFEFDNPRIHLINSAIDSDYEVFITDYSSWVYDFVYLKRKILYFLPDEGFFSSGLNGYREVDIPLQDGFGPFCTSGEQLCMELANVLEGVRPSTQYREADGFFLHYDFKQRERLYRSIRQRIEDGTL